MWFLKFKVQQTEIFVILGHFLPFQPSHNSENQNFKIEKTHLYHTWQSYDVCLLRYGVWRTKFLLFWTVFCPFTTPPPSPSSNNPKNQNFEKIGWRYYHFIQVYHKWQLYDVWFLRCGACRIEFFVIFDNFMPFYSPSNLENKNFEKLNKTPGDIIILQ